MIFVYSQAIVSWVQSVHSKNKIVTNTCHFDCSIFSQGLVTCHALIWYVSLHSAFALHAPLGEVSYQLLQPQA